MKEYVRVFGLGFLVVVAGFFFAFQFVKPSPPTTITIASGGISGAYFAYAQQYQQLLHREGIELKIVNTAGSIDNVKRLMNDEVDIAFVQSGIGRLPSFQSQASNILHEKERVTTENAAKHSLVSLASVYYEPLWLFMSASAEVKSVSELKGKRLAVGADGSGTYALSQLLLDSNGITANNTEFVGVDTQSAVDGLLNNELDYVFVTASVEAAIVQQLLLAPEVLPFNFERAKAYTKRYRFLSETELPQGVIDFQQNIPKADVHLLSAAATLVTRDDFHPALAALLMQVFERVHGQGGILENPRQFPAQDYVDFPLADSAQRYFEYGPPLLQRYLPFWLAVLADQLKVFLIPLVALLIPLMRILPPLYRWRVRSRIYRWYEDLREIELESNQKDLPEELRSKLIGRLESLHRDLMGESIPLSYHDELYHLRVHVELVRESLLANSLNM